jgi:thymidylate synthase (FAD)
MLGGATDDAPSTLQLGGTALAVSRAAGGLRRLAPVWRRSGVAAGLGSLSTETRWSATARTLRHAVGMRRAPGAEEQLRLVFDGVAAIMVPEAPPPFEDFERRDDGSWVPEHREV